MTARSRTPSPLWVWRFASPRNQDILPLDTECSLEETVSWESSCTVIRSRLFRVVSSSHSPKSDPHELVVVNMAARQHRQQPYLSLNPYSRVPTLEEDGFVLFKSTAILNYLEAIRPAFNHDALSLCIAPGRPDRRRHRKASITATPQAIRVMTRYGISAVTSFSA